MEIHYKDSLIEARSKIFVINPYDNFDDLDEGQQFFVEESLKAAQICKDSELKGKELL